MHPVKHTSTTRCTQMHTHQMLKQTVLSRKTSAHTSSTSTWRVAQQKSASHSTDKQTQHVWPPSLRATGSSNVCAGVGLFILLGNTFQNSVFKLKWKSSLTSRVIHQLKYGFLSLFALFLPSELPQLSVHVGAIWKPARVGHWEWKNLTPREKNENKIQSSG